MIFQVIFAGPCVLFNQGCNVVSLDVVGRLLCVWQSHSGEEATHQVYNSCCGVPGVHKAVRVGNICQVVISNFDVVQVSVVGGATLESSCAVFVTEGYLVSIVEI